MREILFRGFHQNNNGMTSIRLQYSTLHGWWVIGKSILSASNVFDERNYSFIAGRGMTAGAEYADDDRTIIKEIRDAYIQKVACETVGQFTGLLDKNGKQIFEGDIILGWRGYVQSDGYMRKGYPDRINVICVVVFGCGAFKLKEIRPADEHIEAAKLYDYRINGTIFNPMRRGPLHYNPVTKKHDIQGDDMTCPDIEVIGNIFENPELLIQPEEA